MNRSNSGRRPPPDPNSIETKYLTSAVGKCRSLMIFNSILLFFEIGPALIRGLAEIVERRPNDPIEYLATFLYKQVENTRAQKQVEIDLYSISLNLSSFVFVTSVKMTSNEWKSNNNKQKKTNNIVFK